MDGKQFARLTRRVAAARSRRGAVQALAVGLCTSLLGGLRREEAEAGLPIVNCKAPGKSCDKNKKCCTGRCRRGRCGCSKKGRPCWAPLEGAMCCSQKCSSGRCA